MSRRLKQTNYHSFIRRECNCPTPSLAFSPYCLLFGFGILGVASTLAVSASVFANTSTSGNVQLDTEVATSIAMKIQSPNDTNPECMTQSGVTYGEANRYATSNGMEGSKQVDTFDGTTGGADEINTNTSCAMLTMNPNAYDSTYSDITVYTNSGNGYALTLEAAEPNLVNTTDNTQYIPAGTLTEQDGTGAQAGTGVVPGGQNAWSYKTDNGIITSWTPVSSTAATIRAYDQETSGGETTRVTYGVSSGNNLTGKYATTLTYTATMFDEANPAVPTANITGAGGSGTPSGATISGDAVRNNKLTVPYKATRTLTITPDEGYYLTAFTCPTGLTCSTVSTGSASDPTAASRTAQTVSITNDSVTGSVVDPISITLNNTYRIRFSKSNISSPSGSYVDVAYGGQTTVTVTPASGYYLSAFSGCPSGWTCSGVSTGTSYTGNQTLTLTNNSSTNTGTLTLSGTIPDPFAACGSTTGSQCTVAGVQYVRLADGHLWTKNPVNSSVTWYNLSTVFCPSGTSKPTASVFNALLSNYGGSYNTDYGFPYGIYAGSGALYNATGWSGDFWSTTEEYDSSNAWYLVVYSSDAYVRSRFKSYSSKVVCYR